jgi:tRNA A37 threonylcarbamoyladenosine dehydratase
VRSGIGKIRLIDFDQVTLSSLNVRYIYSTKVHELTQDTQRHSVATLNDVGTPKVIACQKQYEEIAPWVNVDAQVELFSLDDADRLLAGNPDWVLDCIDNIPTKVDLLAYCHKHNIKVFSAMGAGGKWDPTRVQISDISTTYEDPLARSVRIGLKKEGVRSGIPVVVSDNVSLSGVSLTSASAVLNRSAWQAGQAVTSARRGVPKGISA